MGGGAGRAGFRLSGESETRIVLFPSAQMDSSDERKKPRERRAGKARVGCLDLRRQIRSAYEEHARRL